MNDLKSKGQQHKIDPFWLFISSLFCLSSFVCSRLKWSRGKDVLVTWRRLCEWCDKKVCRPVLGDEEPPWDALRPKAEVTGFQQVIWNWIKGLGWVSGAAPTSKEFSMWVRWWKIKNWWTVGTGAEGDQVGKIQLIVFGKEDFACCFGVFPFLPASVHLQYPESTSSFSSALRDRPTETWFTLWPDWTPRCLCFNSDT